MPNKKVIAKKKGLWTIAVRRAIIAITLIKSAIRYKNQNILSTKNSRSCLKKKLNVLHVYMDYTKPILLF